MSKEKMLTIRIDEKLLIRYEEALKSEGLTKTIHITSEIHRFVEKVENKNKD